MEELLKKHSEKVVNLIIAIRSIILSLIITYIIMRILKNEEYLTAMTIATIVPLIASPLISYKIIKLYKRILIAERIANELATLDFLTKINNRRVFMEKLEIEIDKAKENNSYVSIFILDLDYFKKINDNYGHLAGDEVLKKVAEILKNSIDGSDICGRFGGEEFIVAFPGKDKIEALKIGEKIRSNLDSNIVIDDNIIKFTASIGIVSSMINNETIDSLIKIADENLYKAKENGRNRVEIS